MSTQAGNNQTAGTPQLLRRIMRDPQVMEGRACIRGMRFTVGRIVGQIGAGRTIENVMNDFPYLEREDSLKALQYAAWLAQERENVLATG